MRSSLDYPLQKVAVLGANGYSGLELCKLLLRHPAVGQLTCGVRDQAWHLSQDVFLESNSEKESCKEYKEVSIDCTSPESILERAQEWDTVFLATPHEVSMEWVRAFLGRLNSSTKRLNQSASSSGATDSSAFQNLPNIIDLSGAFRLNPEDFQKYYRQNHLLPEVTQQAQYGLRPWATNFKQVKSLKEDVSAKNALVQRPWLVANPGCYATSCLMALIPVFELIDLNSIVIDAKSGTTGAGRKAAANLIFSEVDGDCLPYKVGAHQHLPEIVRYLKYFSNSIGAKVGALEASTPKQEEPVGLHFTTHLLPVKRGILSSIYLKFRPEFKALSDADLVDRVYQAYQNAYGHYPLVRFGDFNKAPKLMSLNSVVGTAFTHISFGVIDGKLTVFSAIDNLLKGAASQAIENFNVLNNWSPALGLVDSIRHSSKK